MRVLVIILSCQFIQPDTISKGMCLRDNGHGSPMMNRPECLRQYLVEGANLPLWVHESLKKGSAMILDDHPETILRSHGLELISDNPKSHMWQYVNRWCSKLLSCSGEYQSGLVV